MLGKNLKKILIPPVAVLGAGNMGTAMAKILAENGLEVRIWNWEGDLTPLEQIKKYHENKKYLPGIKLSKSVIPVEKIGEALKGAGLVFFAVPSGVMEQTISFAARNVEDGAILVDLSKGVDPHSLKLITDVMAENVRPSLKRNIVSVSGPAIAGQMAKGVRTLMNVASKNKKAREMVTKALEGGCLRLIPTDDVVGVEVGGSFKNVYAIAMGILDSMGCGLNTKAALITCSLSEIGDLIKAMGGKRETVYQLAGIGDLVGTALCEDSRNRRFGSFIGQGFSLKKACEQVGQTVEGVDACAALMKLKKRYKLSLPFAEKIQECVEMPKRAKTIMNDFLNSL